VRARSRDAFREDQLAHAVQLVSFGLEDAEGGSPGCFGGGLARLRAACLNWAVRKARRSPTPKPAFRPAAGWNSRDSVLAEWRRVDLRPAEKAAAVATRSIGELLPALVQKLGLPQRRIEAEVFKAWQSLIDPNLAAHARPTGLRKGTLFVTVDSSVWHSEIVRYRRREILDRLQSCFGREMIAKISFRVG